MSRPLRIARVRADGRAHYGIVRGRTVHFLRGGPFGKLTETGEQAPLSRVQLLAPVTPSKIVAIGLNYRSHLGRVLDRPAPSEPQAFLKAPSSLIGPDAAIVLPPEARQVELEGEIVAVIGRRARHITEAEVDAHVLGYTCGNDVSAREWQANDLQWWRAKSSDTFATAGPWIVTGLDPEALEVHTRLNGTEVQFAPAKDLIFSIRRCISHVSRWITLEPGDLVYTGTPGLTPAIGPGDVIEVEVPGVGVLRNPVILGADTATA